MIKNYREKKNYSKKIYAQECIADMIARDLKPL